MDNFPTVAGGDVIEEGDEIDSDLSDQILSELKSTIDDVIPMQLKPALCTITVERLVLRSLPGCLQASCEVLNRPNVADSRKHYCINIDVSSISD